MSRTPSGIQPRIDRGGIGAALELYYRPRPSKKDPLPGVNSLYWIQRVITNYPIRPEEPGVRRSYIDNKDSSGNNALHHYYAQGIPLAPSGYFGDRPYRQRNLDRDYYWVAELYLAEADNLNPREVTIYNGVRWGWHYEYFRRFRITKPSPPPCSGGSGGGLASTIFKEQQPIGLYSHRGHAAFVLAAVAMLALVARRWQWISHRNFVMAGVLIISALLLTQTRAGVLALLCATAYLLGWKYYKLLIPATLAGLLVVGMTTTTRHIHHLPLIKQVTSDRVYLWELSSRGIFKSPLVGWGFDGFGMAYPYVFNPEWTPQVVSLGDLSFDYWGKNKQLETMAIPTYKAHNLMLDTALSVGVLGMLGYGALFGFCLWQVICSPYRGMEGVAVAYLIFTLTWFECAQFTHIVWWALSLWGIEDELTHSSSFMAFSMNHEQ